MSQVGKPTDSTDDKVLAAPIQLGADDKARKAIESYFPKGLPSNWGVMYHQTKIHGDEKFLCSNWAGHRVKQELVVDKEYPFDNEHPVDTVDYSIGDRVDLLAQLGLWDASKKKFKYIEECKDGKDPERMLIIWGIGKEPPPAEHKDKAHIGHISVKWNGRWESKLSTDQYVITHGEESFRMFDGHEMYPAVYYRRTKTD